MARDQGDNAILGDWAGCCGYGARIGNIRRVCMNPRSARLSTQSPIARKHRPDYGLFITAGILLAVGLIVMYAISPALAAQGGGVSDNYYVLRQFVAVVLGIIAFFVFAAIPSALWGKYQKILIITAIALSIATVVTGGMASRWIQFGILSFQSVELVKLVVIIVFAGYLAKVLENREMANVQVWKGPMIIAAILAFAVVVLQRDLGSAVVLFAIALAMLFMAGIPVGKLIIATTLVVTIGTLAIVATPYRRDRVSTFLQPTADCSDTGYQACQALIAVGSGGVMGVGLGRSVQAYGYLPKAENDSIFAIYAEKFGFIGTIALLGVFGALLLRILRVMQRSPTRLAQLMCAGVFTWFSVQATINIAAMLGLIPLKGITLPFISYGGTSILFSMAALGLVFHISKYTTMRTQRFNDDPVIDTSSQPEQRYHQKPGTSSRRYAVTRRNA